MREIEAMLLWARANKFRVREIQVADIRLVLDDVDAGPPAKLDLPAQDVHAEWARVLGVPYVETDDDDEQEGRT